MLQLLIPSIGLAASVIVGSPYNTWSEQAQDQTKIMETNVYKFPEHNVLAAHDYNEFKDIKGLRYNSLVIFDRTRYRVRQTFLVTGKQTDVILGDDLTLITCEGRLFRIIKAAKY